MKFALSRSLFTWPCLPRRWPACRPRRRSSTSTRRAITRPMRLCTRFHPQTGITVKRIEGKEDELLERIRNEGANSPADVLLTVDAARLAAAHEMGLLCAGQIGAARTSYPGASAHQRLVFVFHARARHHLCQGRRQARGDPQLQRSGRSAAEGQGLLALGFAPLQSVADGFDHRPSGRGQSRGVGEGRGRQLRAPAEGRRYRSDPGGRCRRVCRGGLQHLLSGAPDALGQGRGSPDDGADRRRLA
jgi:hypothetical protein